MAAQKIVVQEQTGKFPGAVVVLKFAEGEGRATVRSGFILDTFLCGLGAGTPDADARIVQANAYASALGKILDLKVELLEEDS